jgi:hypothetical protein
MAFEQYTDETLLLAERFGIGMDSTDADLIPAVDVSPLKGMALDEALQLAQDAPTNLIQSGMVTISNAGIPNYLSNYLDPEIVRVMTVPLKAVDIFGEKKKGDWLMDSAQFPIIEATGEVSAYGDDNDNGLVGANANWIPRQSFAYQCFTRWGDKELAKAGLAKLDWAAEQNVSSALIMNTFQNRTYFFGVANLDNYGITNDPSLSASISPLNGVWKSATGVQIFQDIQNLFVTLQNQLQGNIEMEDDLILGLPSTVQPYLLTPMQNVYGTPSLKAYLKEAFPKLVIKTAQQYVIAGSGNLVQLIAPKVQGQQTGFCAFTEKMRAHAIVRKTSSTHQKKSGGSWGFILKIPAGVVSIIGV